MLAIVQHASHNPAWGAPAFVGITLIWVGVLGIVGSKHNRRFDAAARKDDDV